MWITPFLCALTLQSAVAEAPAPVPDVSATLKTVREQHDVPGLVAVVVREGKIVARGAHGVRKRGSPEAITVDDRMHIGSCTKSMTATLCAILVEEKKLAWDTKVVDVFPELAGTIDAGWKEARLDQLLTNHGGAPENLDAGGLWAKLWLQNGKPRDQRLELVKGVLSRPPAARPGTKFIYSNAGFSIAGAMAERVLDAPYEDLMRQYVFGPLDMKSAGFGAPGRAGIVDQPRGHAEDGRAIEPGAQADNPIAIAPAGRVHCSLVDWAKYVAAHAVGERDADDGRKHLLSGAGFKKLHAPFAAPDSNYAMGWIAESRDGKRTLWHNGSNTMWYAEVLIDLDAGAAVLVAANQFGEPGQGAVTSAVAALSAEWLRPAAGTEAK